MALEGGGIETATVEMRLVREDKRLSLCTSDIYSEHHHCDSAISFSRQQWATFMAHGEYLLEGMSRDEEERELDVIQVAFDCTSPDTQESSMSAVKLQIQQYDAGEGFGVATSAAEQELVSLQARNPVDAVWARPGDDGTVTVGMSDVDGEEVEVDFTQEGAKALVLEVSDAAMLSFVNGPIAAKGGPDEFHFSPEEYPDDVISITVNLDSSISLVAKTDLGKDSIVLALDGEDLPVLLATIEDAIKSYRKSLGVSND